jgi:membrane protein DedA with SNARE-associated domain
MLKHVSSVSSGWLMGSWWGFAEADRVVLGVMVVVLAALAAVYTVMRILRTRGESDRKRAAGGVAHARRGMS